MRTWQPPSIPARKQGTRASNRPHQERRKKSQKAPYVARKRTYTKAGLEYRGWISSNKQMEPWSYKWTTYSRMRQTGNSVFVWVDWLVQRKRGKNESRGAQVALDVIIYCDCLWFSGAELVPTCRVGLLTCCRATRRCHTADWNYKTEYISSTP